MSGASKSPVMVKRKNLATLITRSVFIIVFVLTLMLLFQNYQVSKQIVSLEVARSTLQTSSLLQSIFNFKLTSLEIQQDSYTRSGLLVSSISNSQLGKLDSFFNSVDNMDPALSPDFRFILYKNKLIWSDDRLKFYGITSRDLSKLGHELSSTSSWRLTRVSSMLGTQYVLARHTPLIDMRSGEAVGLMYIGVVLNNNFRTYALIAPTNFGNR